MLKKTTGQKLVELRGSRTREQVSFETGIMYPTLYNYENDLRVPKDKVKKILADYYGVEIQDLFY